MSLPTKLSVDKSAPQTDKNRPNRAGDVFRIDSRNVRMHTDTFSPTFSKVSCGCCRGCGDRDVKLYRDHGSLKEICNKCSKSYAHHLTWLSHNYAPPECPFSYENCGRNRECHVHIIRFFETEVGIVRQFHPNWPYTTNTTSYSNIAAGSVLLFNQKDLRNPGITRVLLKKQLGVCRIGEIYSAEDSSHTKIMVKLYKNQKEYAEDLDLLRALEDEFNKDTGEHVNYIKNILSSSGHYFAIALKVINNQLPFRIRSLGNINRTYKPVDGSQEQKTMLSPFTFKYLGADVTYKRVKSGTPCALVDVLMKIFRYKCRISELPMSRAEKVKEKGKRSWKSFTNNVLPAFHFSDELNLNIIQYNVREPEGLDPGVGHAIMVYRTATDPPAATRLCDSGGFLQTDTDKLHPTLKNKITDLYWSKLNTVLVEPVPRQLHPTACFRHSWGNAILICAGLDPKGYQLDERAVFGLIKDFVRDLHTHTKWLDLAQMIILHPVAKKAGFKIHLINTDDS